jgi:putative ABC transport system permease protein
MFNDIKSAIRSLRHSPTFTAVALVVLALGIGSATAIFSVVDAVVLRALPFPEHDRLAAVLSHDTRRPTTFGSGSATPQTYLDWRAQQRSFDGLAAVSRTSFGIRDAEGHLQTARGLQVTSEFFQVLRVSPMLGRGFSTDEETIGRHRVVILSFGSWQRLFGGSPDAVGKTLALDDESWEIVGVMPRGFAYPVASATPTELFVPLAFRSEDRVRGSSQKYNCSVIGRLKPGTSLAGAADDMNRVAAALDAQYPKWEPGRRVRIETLQDHLVGKVKTWMLMLLGAVALVLVIACANVANLMLARATVRGPEIALRSALGASRGAIIRGLLVEAVLLSLGGAAIGVLLALVGVRAILPWLPDGIPRVAAIAIDLRVLVAAIAAALVTGVAFGLVPAIQASRPNLTAVLKSSSRSSTTGAGSHRVRSALVIAEVAVAMVLLVGAGLFIGSFARLMRVDPGFDYRQVLVVDVGLSWQPGKIDVALKQGAAYTEQMLNATRRVPGVLSAAAVANGLPLEGSWSRTSLTIPGRGELSSDEDSIDNRVVTPGYLKLMRIPLVRGRYLSDGDRAGAQLVLVVNQSAARRYWPGQDALGQRVVIESEERLIVGVVGDIRHLGPETPPRQECYVPMAQGQVLGGTLVMRTAGDPLRILPAVKTAVWSVNKDQRISGDTFTLEGYMDALIAQRRFNMAVLALFGVLGLGISAAGTYGVMAYLVAQRTHEIGVRIALGATKRSILGLVLRRAAWLIAIGLAIGAGVSWYSSAAVARFLFQVEPDDPLIFGGALAVLALTGLAASAVPARRAAAVDPIVALRSE